jgi:hypothetical protein
MTAAQPASSRSSQNRTRRKVSSKAESKKGAVPKVRRRKSAVARIEGELPKELREFSRMVRRDLTQLEEQIEGARKDLRRGLTRSLREVSHQLGRFEAEGERRWKKLTLQARRDAVKALQKLEKAIEPPKKKRKPAIRKAKGKKVGA